MIYLDHAAATPTDKRVLKATQPYFGEIYGNPSGLHQLSRQAARAILRARQAIADFLACRPEEVIFTSGGTESDNLAILGAARLQRCSSFGQARKYKKGHIITSKIEHPAVLNACRQLEKEGFKVTYLAPSRAGLVSAEAVRGALRPDTVLVTIMMANNEIGTIQPIAKIGQIIAKFRRKTRRATPLFHTDACQAAGYLSLDVQKLGVDLMSFTGAKIYAPKGIGVLYRKTGVELEPLVFGGGQEGNLRSGTENVPGIVGIGAAVQNISPREGERESKLRDLLIEKLLRLPGCRLNGDPHKRLPNNVNVTIAGVEGESAVLYLDRLGVACSTGSACSSKSLDPSHVLEAIGVDKDVAHCSLRLTLGRTISEADILRAAAAVEKVAGKLRQITSLK